MKSILFVCLGNICRSPLAEGIARDILKEKNLHVKVDSAGTGSWHIGKPPCPDSIKVAKLHSHDISTLRARRVTKEDNELFDYIIVMDSNNLADIRDFGITKAVKLGDFGFDGADVPDPYYYRDFEGFEKVYSMIYKGVSNFIAKSYEI